MDMEEQRQKYAVELLHANAKYFLAVEEKKQKDANLDKLRMQINEVHPHRNLGFFGGVG